MRLSIQSLPHDYQCLHRRKKDHLGKWGHADPFAVVSLPVARQLQKLQHTASIFNEHRLYLLLQLQGKDGTSDIKLVKTLVDASSMHPNRDDCETAHGNCSGELFCNRHLLASLVDTVDLASSTATVLRVLTEAQIVVWKRVVLTPVSSAEKRSLHPTYIHGCIRGTVLEKDSIVKLPTVHTTWRGGGGSGGLPDRHEYVAFRVSSVVAPAGAASGMRFGLVGWDIPGETVVHVERYHESTVHRFSGQKDMIYELVIAQEQTTSILKLVQFALRLSNEGNLQHMQFAYKSLILHGPRGVGKSTMVECIARKLGAQLFRITAADVYSEQYSQEEDIGASGLSSMLKHASLQQQPAILLIDDVDVLFPRDDDSKDIHLVNEMSKLLRRLCSKDGASGQPFAHVALIGITSRIGAVDSFVRKRFQEEVFVDVPTMDERRAIVRRFARLISACSSISDAQLDELSDRCHGYVQADIQAMFRFAAHRAMVRRFNGGSDSIQVEDFDAHSAAYGYRPCSIREASMAITVPQVPRVEWSDIGGLNDVKSQLHEMIVWPLKHSDAFVRMGIQPPTGILLYGPPGTGKTLLAKAVASASSANFISVSIPDLIKAEVGESEKTLSEMFRRAKLAAPSVVFFDEIQAMFGDRDNVSIDQQKLISQLFLEMDALTSSEDDNDDGEQGDLTSVVSVHSRGRRGARNVVVIAATNVPQNIDTSLMRPGRFERVLYVAPPDPDARLSILKMTLKDMKVSEAMHSPSKMQELVDRTENYTGADLVNLCHQAGLHALCNNIDASEITAQDFEHALSNVRPSFTDVTMLSSVEIFGGGTT